MSVPYFHINKNRAFLSETVKETFSFEPIFLISIRAEPLITVNLSIFLVWK